MTLLSCLNRRLVQPKHQWIIIPLALSFVHFLLRTILIQQQYRGNVCSETDVERKQHKNISSNLTEELWESTAPLETGIVINISSAWTSEHAASNLDDKMPEMSPIADEFDDAFLVSELCLRQRQPWAWSSRLFENTQVVFGCQQMATMESLQQLPRLYYGEVTGTTNRMQRKGTLAMSDDVAFDVTRHDYSFDPNYESWKQQHPYTADALGTFEFRKELLLKLIEMINWPAIPRVYGACVRTRSQMDVCETNDMGAALQPNGKIFSIRYLVQRVDAERPLCDSHSYDANCRTLVDLRGFLRLQTNPPHATFLILFNLSKAFNTFLKAGIVPLRIMPRNIRILPDFSIVFSNIDTFHFLTSTRSTSNSRHSRLLGDVMCRSSNECFEVDALRYEDLLIHFGSRCGEVVGYCGNNSRCWGIDAHTFVCVFSHWLFKNLHGLIPVKSKPEMNTFNNIIGCSEQRDPPFRCRWPSIMKGFDGLVHYANFN